MARRSQLLSAALASLLLFSSSFAQTYSKCNPLQQTCPADPALGGSANVNFASESSDYTGSGNTISYTSSGAQLSVAASGNNPTLSSNWYIMFGHVDFVVKTAPGVGMVSSCILISDDLDEIDWEILGASPTQAQTNYFGKGQVGTYNRGGFATTPDSTSEFVTYSIDWTSTQITWSVNGAAVRTLTPDQAGGQYPQTPMQVKVGAWAGGDSSNAEGTIQWAGGPINYAAGPYSMYVQSVNVQDYSTGKQYQYGDMSGSWQSITAVDGSVNSGSGSYVSTPTTPTTSGLPYTETWTGTHQETSAYVTPSTWPWVASSGLPYTTESAGPPASSYLAGLGYNVNSASSATVTIMSSSPSSYPSASASSTPTGSSAPTTMTTAIFSSVVASGQFDQGLPTGTSTPAPYNPANSAGRKTVGTGLALSAVLTVIALML